MSAIQIIVMVVMIAAPVLGQVIKKLAELKEQKRIEQERAALREEMLRTGRAPAEVTTTPARPAQPPVSQGGAAARTNLEEIARRRQAELQELRRRQQASAQAGRSTPAPPRPTAAPRPTAPSPSAPRPTAPRPTPRPAPQRPTARPVTPRPSRPTARPTRQRPSRQPVEQAAPRRKLVSTLSTAPSPERAPSIRTPVQVGGQALPTSPEAWRQAIVLTEILAPPVSMRSDHL